MYKPQRPSYRADFEVAIICALPLEYDAVLLLFDQRWDEGGDPYGRATRDLNTYTTGRIGKYNVVLILLSETGKGNAASAAASVRSSYTGLRLALLVGVCGGVPRTGKGGGDEVLLGDVVISKIVVQYDFGSQYPDQFIMKDTFGKPTRDIRNFLILFETDDHSGSLREGSIHYLDELQNRAISKGRGNKYNYPGTSEDKLFRPNYRHKHHGSPPCICNQCSDNSHPVCEGALKSSCADLQCDDSFLVPRERLKEKQKMEQDNNNEFQAPAIHIGGIASGDTVMKSGEHRDDIAGREGVIAFEMEGAGVWEEVPCIVVKGVCDYADCHKNKKWQNFAAATAASTMKAILERYIQTDKVPGAVYFGGNDRVGIMSNNASNISISSNGQVASTIHNNQNYSKDTSQLDSPQTVPPPPFPGRQEIASKGEVGSWELQTELLPRIEIRADVGRRHFAQNKGDENIQTANKIAEKQSGIPTILSPPMSPEDILSICKSFAQRRKSWNPWPKGSVDLFRSLQHWVSTPGSALFVVRATRCVGRCGNHRAKARAKDFAVEVADFLKSTTTHKVIWTFSLSKRPRMSITDILNILICQAVRFFPSQPNIPQSKANDTESQLFELLRLLLSQLPMCFVVIETTNIEGTARFLRLSQDIVDRSSSMIKILVVSHGKALPVLPNLLQNNNRIVATIQRLPPRSRKPNSQYRARATHWQHLNPRFSE